MGVIGAKSLSGALTNSDLPPENANAPGQVGAAVARAIETDSNPFPLLHVQTNTTGIVLAMLAHSRLLAGRVGP
jgi:hypothetical protein